MTSPPPPDPDEAEQRELLAIRAQAELVIGDGGAEVERFLRQVIARRDGDQLMDDGARLAELRKLSVELSCLGCGKRVHVHDGAGLSPLHLCTPCGGRKRQRELERAGFGELLARRATRVEARPALQAAPPEAPTGAVLTSAPEVADEDLDGLLERANATIPEETMSEERLCPNCGKKLRSNNQRGACSKCWTKGYRPGDLPVEGVEAVPRKPRARPTGDVEARFSAVVEALGLDREEVLRGLMQGWLDNLKARFASGEAA